MHPFSGGQTALGQVKKLCETGYPEGNIATASQKCLKLIKARPYGEPNVAAEERKKYAAIPYTHGLSHRLKKAASRYNVDVVYNAKKKLSSICPALHKRLHNKALTRQTTRNTNHSIAFVSCLLGSTTAP